MMMTGGVICSSRSRTILLGGQEAGVLAGVNLFVVPVCNLPHRASPSTHTITYGHQIADSWSRSIEFGKKSGVCPNMDDLYYRWRVREEQGPFELRKRSTRTMVSM
ncbi:hypothetical protein M378DRAFT_904326 [Amanita muscaria Koide BX008]|uniref:Uncharacterized protein n=1 Tax=Amanita muscaria (strain Koide BX008) TaxID=946122 RepID=A0A0C2T2U7_AMAMK|nr:hypothetical protein M378DRAFT_904326 [Amanita muscaria Koide BX008]